MQPRKLKVVFGFFSFGGNGNTASEHPDIRDWIVPTVLKMNSDPRIEPNLWRKDIDFKDIPDTPITMCRNAMFAWAKSVGADVLVCVDSDNSPDIGILTGLDSSAEPFFSTSFDFLYKHYEQFPTVIGAPYCGPPLDARCTGNENVYVFLWRNFDSVNPLEQVAFKLEQFTREEAAMRIGIEPVAALPTGCIMYDMRVLECIDKPYFDYEYKGDGMICPTCNQRAKGPMEEKHSTEDVMFTRNIAINGFKMFGHNPLHCNWNAWAGHWKPRCIGKPRVISSDSIGEHLRKALSNGVISNKRIAHIHRSNRLPKHPLDGQPVEKCIPVNIVNEADTREKLAADPSYAGHANLPSEYETLKGLASVRAMEVSHTDVMRVVELGTWVGKSAVAIAKGVEAVRGMSYEVHCFDKFDGSGDTTDAMRDFVASGNDPVWELFKKNTEGLNIAGHRNDSVIAASFWGQRQEGTRGIDMLFLDAQHSYEGVLDELNMWVPFVVDGGMVCGHDYNTTQYPGVTAAVNEYFGEDRVVAAGGIWFTRVRRGVPRVAVEMNGHDGTEKRAA